MIASLDIHDLFSGIAIRKIPSIYTTPPVGLQFTPCNFYFSRGTSYVIRYYFCFLKNLYVFSEFSYFFILPIFCKTEEKNLFQKKIKQRLENAYFMHHCPT